MVTLVFCRWSMRIDKDKACDSYCKAGMHSVPGNGHHEPLNLISDSELGPGERSAFSSPSLFVVPRTSSHPLVHSSLHDPSSLTSYSTHPSRLARAYLVPSPTSRTTRTDAPPHPKIPFRLVLLAEVTPHSTIHPFVNSSSARHRARRFRIHRRTLFHA
jgi:hypothetical protein